MYKKYNRHYFVEDQKFFKSWPKNVRQEALFFYKFKLIGKPNSLCLGQYPLQREYFETYLKRLKNKERHPPVEKHLVDIEIILESLFKRKGGVFDV